MSFDRESFHTSLALGAEEMGIDLDEQVAAGFVFFAEYVVEANRRLNLTRITEEREMAVKHFLDSLAVTKVPGFCAQESCVDLGTGAGFPGVPLKIFEPVQDWTLVDSVGKKVAFVQEAIEYLGLDGIRGVGIRAEELAVTARERFDVVVCRSVGSIAEVAELSLPLVREGGFVVLMKGPEAEPIEEAALLEELGGVLRPANQIHYELPFGLGKRRLLVLTKVKQAKEKYPRRVGLARKRPLF